MAHVEYTAMSASRLSTPVLSDCLPAWAFALDANAAGDVQCCLLRTVLRHSAQGSAHLCGAAFTEHMTARHVDPRLRSGTQKIPNIWHKKHSSQY